MTEIVCPDCLERYYTAASRPTDLELMLKEPCEKCGGTNCQVVPRARSKP